MTVWTSTLTVHADRKSFDKTAKDWVNKYAK